ncbi:MAG: hypothetical protein COB49_01930 [Alphaproteobacteria bacterium]|nr:MAG: hypothetical protein COB49_01930 [Alphaproteobacteria bacterium]
MSLSLVTPPATDLVTLTEAKAQIRDDGVAEDALIQTYISAMNAYLDGVDGVLGRALVTQVWDLNLPCFPANALRLPLPPLQVVNSVSYVDAGGVTQTVASFQTYDQNGVGFIRPDPGASWPTTKVQENAVTVRFTAGYGAASLVPASIRLAALMLIGSAVKNREAEIATSMSAPNPAVDRLLRPFTIQAFA